MSTLVFLEHHGSAIQRGALGVLGKAAQLDPETAGVIVGSGVREAAAERRALRRQDGLRRR